MNSGPDDTLLIGGNTVLGKPDAATAGRHFVCWGETIKDYLTASTSMTATRTQPDLQRER